MDEKYIKDLKDFLLLRVRYNILFELGTISLVPALIFAISILVCEQKFNFHIGTIEVLGTIAIPCCFYWLFRNKYARRVYRREKKRKDELLNEVLAARDSFNSDMDRNIKRDLLIYSIDTSSFSTFYHSLGKTIEELDSETLDQALDQRNAVKERLNKSWDEDIQKLTVEIEFLDSLLQRTHKKQGTA